jgi:hemolysin III
MFEDYLREPFNAISHAVGAVLGVVGLGVLLVLATGVLQVISSVIYGVSLIFLYASSSIYHGINTTQDAIDWFNRLDKIAIYTLIAGTATPLALIKLEGYTSLSLFTLVWGTTIFGILYEIWTGFDSTLGSLIIYLLMGWSAVLYAEPMYYSLTGPGFALCLAGGILYTLGGFIYFFDWPELATDHFGAHELWHVFCLCGSVTHYVAVSVYMI